MAENKDPPPNNTKETTTVLLVSSIDSWFSNVAYFLTYGECPPNMSYKERQNLRLKDTKYHVI